MIAARRGSARRGSGEDHVLLGEGLFGQLRAEAGAAQLFKNHLGRQAEFRWWTARGTAVEVYDRDDASLAA
jgi:hypothetical protein